MLIYFHDSCRVRSHHRRFGRITWSFEVLDRVPDETGKKAERWMPCDTPAMNTRELEDYLLNGGTDRGDKDFSQVQTVGFRAK
jgi:hypothetical protein